MKAVKNICKKMGVDGCQKNPLFTKQITRAILENSFVVPQNVKHSYHMMQRFQFEVYMPKRNENIY